jgi:TetR/AcrR family transcriptional regulator, copper-responsive repressor
MAGTTGLRERIYQSGRGRYTTTTLASGKSAQESFRNLFDIAAFELTRPGQPRGCMLALSMTTSSPGHETLRKELKRRRALSAREFLSRLEEAVLQKELPTSSDLDALDSFLMTTLMGMSLQARSGATRRTLLKIADMALHAWPSAPKEAAQKTPGMNRQGMPPAKTLR